MVEEEKDKKDTPYKVVLIGESGVGKTCIMAQFISNKFDPNTITSATAQFFIKNIEIDGKILTFHFWDTAGQEKFRSLAKIFYKDAHVVILVYSITNSDSFKIMKDYWYDQVVTYGKKDVIYAIAANKSDSYEERQVSDDEGEEFAKKIGAIFVSTSAKNDVGISELFDEIGQKILNKNNFNFFSRKKIDKPKPNEKEKIFKNKKEKKIEDKKEKIVEDKKEKIVEDKKEKIVEDKKEEIIENRKENDFEFEILEKEDFKDFFNEENIKANSNNKSIRRLTIENKKKKKKCA